MMEEQAIFVNEDGQTIDGGWHYANAQSNGHVTYLVRAYLSAFPGQASYLQQLPVVSVNEKNKRI